MMTDKVKVLQSRCFGSWFSRAPEIERKIRAANPEYNAKFEYKGNEVKTSRYNIITFLPLNLWSQFHRVANIYFFVLAALQMIPIISSLSPVTTLGPLAFVLGLTALKDAIEDMQRHKSDKMVNNRLVSIVVDRKKPEKTPWRKLKVGQVVLLKQNEPIPADLLLLSTSDESGLCFIDTAELDGETNLKVRQCLGDTQGMGDHLERLFLFDGDITCEPPNNNIGRFDGKMDWKGKQYSLDNDKILLRGCTMRNTHWATGLVIYAGPETKLMRNSGKSVVKRTQLDKRINFMIFGILCFLCCTLIIAGVNSGVWEGSVGITFQIYLPWEDLIAKQSMPALVAGCLHFFSYLILMQTVVPISLYVSIEFIRLLLSFFIDWDVDMFYFKRGRGAHARSTTLNEELGQIEYIFTDKTGTLTQNVMTFNKMSINAVAYGDVKGEEGDVIEITPKNEKKYRVDFKKNPYHTNFKWFDASIMYQIDINDRNAGLFLRLLALCHTVMSEERFSEETKKNVLTYQAQSPDEAALVDAARNFGYVFKSRTSELISIEVNGTEEVYQVLAILDFDNYRKRMSVVLKFEGQIVLWCKGADNLVMERIDIRQKEMLEGTQQHLDEFAGSGLRTLAVAVREIDEDQYRIWEKNFKAANCAIHNREDAVRRCCEELERNMTLIGATAIEDKLQDGVPQTIKNLANSGMKIWVLTGDKQETAINIGYSCNMLNEGMEEFIVDGDSLPEVRQQLIRTRTQMDKVRQSLANPKVPVVWTGATAHQPRAQAADQFDGFALIINGHSLIHALSPKLETLLLDVSCDCRAVICCRVTPLQKAQVVDMVKRNKKTITLAIGDGANDVNMIKTAHIGVGIQGEEGMQAVLAADFSFSQFRFLQKLLLCHGRYAYLRIAQFLVYFFYKNFAFTVTHFWFGIMCGWSAQTVYDTWFIMCYNLVYTALPVMCVGWFDQDVNMYYSQKFPKLYQPGFTDKFFNARLFFTSCLEGVYSSAVIFSCVYFGMGHMHAMAFNDGVDFNSFSMFGIAIGTTLVLTVTVRCFLDMGHWTIFNFIAIIVSLGLTFGVQLLFTDILSPLVDPTNHYTGAPLHVWAQPLFWLVSILATVAANFPLSMLRYTARVMESSLMDRVRILQSKEGKQPQDYDMFDDENKPKSRKSMRRSGYAFSQTGGFGAMIKKGTLKQKPSKSNKIKVQEVEKPVSTREVVMAQYFKPKQEGTLK